MNTEDAIRRLLLGPAALQARADTPAPVTRPQSFAPRTGASAPDTPASAAAPAPAPYRRPRVRSWRGQSVVKWSSWPRINIGGLRHRNQREIHREILQAGIHFLHYRHRVTGLFGDPLVHRVTHRIAGAEFQPKIRLKKPLVARG